MSLSWLVTVILVGQMHIGIDSVFDTLGKSLVPLKGSEEILGVPRFKGGKDIILTSGKDGEILVIHLINFVGGHRGSI